MPDLAVLHHHDLSRGDRGGVLGVRDRRAAVLDLRRTLLGTSISLDRGVGIVRCKSLSSRESNDAKYNTYLPSREFALGVVRTTHRSRRY